MKKLFIIFSLWILVCQTCVLATEKYNDDQEINAMFSSYMRNMQRSIKANWNPQKSNSSKRVVLTYKIGKDGKLLKYKVLKSSGDKSMDDAAIKALKKTAPFAPLPEEFKDDSVDVQFTFDYNVFARNKKE